MGKKKSPAKAAEAVEKQAKKRSARKSTKSKGGELDTRESKFLVKWTPV
jgi:hypothetical protein